MYQEYQKMMALEGRLKRFKGEHLVVYVIG